VAKVYFRKQTKSKKANWTRSVWL